MKKLALWLGVLVFGFAAGCGRPGGPGGPGGQPTGSLNASLSIDAGDGISSVRIDVLQAMAVVASKTVALANSTPTGLVGDAFFVLPPGAYTVTATPLDDTGKPSASCASASASATVVAGQTNEIMLTLVCRSQGSGGLDVVVTTSHPPAITDLVFDPSKFTQVCVPTHITVKASNPDMLTLGYVWSIVARPAGASELLPPGVASELTSVGPLATFDAAVPGTFTLKVDVTDAAGDDASLTFPVHVEPGPACQGSQPLSGYVGVPPAPPSDNGLPGSTVAPIVGAVPASASVDLAVGLPVRDAQGLKALLKNVADPKSGSFRQYLTQSQFAATYGATDADYQALQDWATGAGLTVKATYSNKLLVDVSGGTVDVEKALHANLVFRTRKDGSKFIALDREPSLDLSVPILRISGLTGFVAPFHKALNGTGGGRTYRAADLRAAYLGPSSVCQSLDGTGQVVGIVDFDFFQPSDIAMYDGLQTPPINPANVTVVHTEGGGTPATNSALESTIDVELVQAMAPAAKILFFQGSTGLTGHLDDALHAMATSSPPLTVASCSLGFGRSDNAQQALDQMAAQGVTFLTASGDFGDIGDPQGNEDMGNQTLVGGTSLSTNPLVAGSPPYPATYYAGETTWNDGNAMKAQDVTSGGVMDGNNQNGYCFCFPYPLCCGSGVGIPDYQVGVSMATNGGSTQFRNYPDVAMLAEGAEMVFQGSATGGVVGTSMSAPLWAGYMALVNQQSLLNSAGLAGFINPTVYDIGLTRGSSNDLYAACFNDVADGANNFDGFGSGFTTVAGYDLTTGWGSPTCQLLNQLSTTTPLTPHTPLGLIEFVIKTGDDDLRGGGCGTGATADVLLTGGGSFSVTLHATGSGAAFDNGTTHTLDFAVPSTVSPPLTSGNGIAGVTINIQEHYSFPCQADNWDIANLGVTLFNPSTAKVCQLALVGSSTLQDGNTGLVRLSESAGSSGVGPSATFTTGPGSGCP